MKKLLFLFFLYFFCFSLFAQNFVEGEKFFKTNKPAQAISVFESLISSDSVDPSIYNYLGLSYYQLGRYEESYNTFILGTEKTGTDLRILYFNAGNSAFAMGNFEKAEECYNFAVIADPLYASAVLNRANSRIELDKLSEAASDYRLYLNLLPESVQSEQIQKLLAMLDKEIENKKEQQKRIEEEKEKLRIEKERIEEQKNILEQERLLREEKMREEQAIIDAKKAEEEALRIAEEEAKQAAEAERRKELLRKVAESLKNAEVDKKKAGSEGIKEYENEGELD